MKSKITYRTAVRNIRKLYAEIPQADREASVNWYLRAHNEIRARYAKYELYQDYPDLQEGLCHVVAALSPGVRWDTNLEDFERLLSVWPECENVSVRTYPAQRDKASRILLGVTQAVKTNWREILKGPKERAFAHNLAYPEAERELTLDFHAISIATNYRYTYDTAPQLKVAERAAIDRAYRAVAAENNLKACQLQAITWEWWRKTRPAPRFHRTKGKVVAV